MFGLTPWLVAAVAGLGALLVAALLTEPLRRLALRHGYTDQPNARKAHKHPTPYLGGVAVALATLACAGVPVLAVPEGGGTAGVLLVGAALVAVLGLVDDLRQLSIRCRLGFEAAAALAVVLWCGHPQVFGGWPDVLLAVGWVLFTTNAFNLLDNMDGVVSTVTAITAGFLCGAALLAGLTGTAAVMAALAGACAGFLLHNWHPARIFLGDAGSLFVGFLVSSATLTLHQGTVAAPSGYTGPLLITLVVTVDTGLVMVARRRAGRPLLQGGKDHIAHRLHRLGLTVSQVALFIGAFAALTCLAAMLVMHRAFPGTVVLIAVVTVTAAAWALLLRVPVYSVPGGDGKG